MRDSLGDRTRLLHISESIDSILNFTKGVPKEQFINHYMLQLAVTKLLEIIGEATAKLSPELRDEFPEVEWTLIIRSRNVYVHQYFALDLETVWSTVIHDLPLLKSQVDNILAIKFPQA